MQAFLLAYIQETEERLSKKASLRTQNLAVAKDRPELNTALLDSSLRKNTAFIKKLVSTVTDSICFIILSVECIENPFLGFFSPFDSYAYIHILPLLFLLLILLFPTDKSPFNHSFVPIPKIFQINKMYN